MPSRAHARWHIDWANRQTSRARRQVEVVRKTNRVLRLSTRFAVCRPSFLLAGPIWGNTASRAETSDTHPSSACA